MRLKWILTSSLLTTVISSALADPSATAAIPSKNVIDVTAHQGQEGRQQAWGVAIGGYASKKALMADWATIQRKDARVAEGLAPVFESVEGERKGKKKAAYRLRLEPFATIADARRVCRMAGARRSDCVVYASSLTPAAKAPAGEVQAVAKACDTSCQTVRKIFASNNLGKSYRDLIRIHRTQPNNPDVLNGLAIVYDKLGRFDMSDRYYARALMHAPDRADIASNFGYSLMLQGRIPEAVAYLARVSVQWAGHAPIRNNLELARSMLDAAAPQPAQMQAGLADQNLLVRVNWGTQRLVTRPDAGLVRTAVDEGVMPRYAATIQAYERPAVVRIASKDVMEPAPDPTERAAPAPLPEAAPVVATALAAETAPVPVIPVEKAPDLRSLSFVVSNGAGVPGLAAQVRSYLTRQGMPWGPAVNAKHFGFRKTVIQFRPEKLAEARWIAARLNRQVELREVKTLEKDIILRLGADAAQLGLSLKG